MIRATIPSPSAPWFTSPWSSTTACWMARGRIISWGRLKRRWNLGSDRRHPEQIMKNEMAEIHPQLRGIAGFNPMLKLDKIRAGLINRLMPWVIRPRSIRDVNIENVWINRPDSQQVLRIRVYQPKNPSIPVPALLWLHGGGYVIGTPEMDDRVCADFARTLNMIVFSVDYRLAPTHPFPAALEDGYSALKWMASRSEKLGLDPERIAIGGASAGGGLAAAITQLAYDRNNIKPVFQLLIYSMLDDRTSARIEMESKRYLVWPHSSNRFGWESYLGQPCGEEHVPSYSVPARREDLSGLPPAWIGVGALDMFHEENTDYAKRLDRAGIEVDLETVPGAFHGFDVAKPNSSIARQFRDAQIAALKKYLMNQGK